MRITVDVDEIECLYEILCDAVEKFRVKAGENELPCCTFYWSERNEKILKLYFKVQDKYFRARKDCE